MPPLLKKPNLKAQNCVCLCNRVPRERIEQAIARGCKTMSLIFDATTAGVGPCGGSCRPQITQMLESYVATGKFPEKLPPTRRPK